MRMVHQSPAKLVLLHRPVALCAVLVLAVLLLLAVTLWNLAQAEWLKAALGFASTLGLLVPAVWFAAERVDVTFDAVQQTVSLNIRRLSGPSEEVFPLAAVQKAMVQTHKGPGDTSGAHRVALVLAPGDLKSRRPLTTGYASGRGAADLVARINSWLEQARGDSNA